MKPTHEAQRRPSMPMRVCAPPARKPAGRSAAARAAVVARCGSYSTVTTPEPVLAWALRTPGTPATAASTARPSPSRFSPSTGRSMRASGRAGLKPVVAEPADGERFRHGERCLRVAVRVGVELRDAIG